MHNLRLRLVIQTSVFILGLAALLFLGAGTFAWPDAWWFLIETESLSIAIGLWLAAHDPILLEERLRLTHDDQAAWDRMFLVIAGAVFVIWLVVMGVQRRAATLLSSVPLQVFGATLTIVSLGLSAWTFRENSFAVPQVRAQTDRVQATISTGPYAHVRHPMYTAAILYFLGVPLQLGAWWGLFVVPTLAGALAWRIGGEEATLLDTLPDYARYRAKVRFRLLPGLW